MDVGSVCVKTAGREAGKKVVVLEIVDKNYVLVEGPRAKKRKCAITHLMPTGKKVELKKGAKKEELARAVE
ncbi:MAG: 50S ribosomal protein L14e [archaeon]|nr:50S ribosomal protein L14e [archaeon]